MPDLADLQAKAHALDEADPLGSFQDRFLTPDGNSLGRPARSS